MDSVKGLGIGVMIGFALSLAVFASKIYKDTPNLFGKSKE